MQITLKLYATLTDYLPAAARASNQMTVAVTPDATITSVLAPLNLPEKQVHLVLVNGVFIPPGDRATRIFADGDVLAIWPPIAGG